MKKFKIISFIILILLGILFLFATCRKANAVEDSYYANKNLSLDSSDSNTSCLFYYLPSNYNYQDILMITFTDNDGQNYIYFSLHEQKLKIYWNTWVDVLDEQISSNTKLCCVYVVISPNDNNNTRELTLNYGFISYNGSNFVDNSKTYYFQNIAGQKVDNMNYAYENNNISVRPYVKNVTPYSGYINGFIFDWLDYGSTTFSEYIDDVKDDYLTTAKSNFSTYLYNAGYNIGYQAGYDDGYAAGQTAGYNRGYNIGYADGLADNTTAYNHGYDEGRADGYREGLVTGYDDGYATGYDVGFTEGQAGATPVSKTIGVVSSIFAGIGSVLAVELFPGFSIGILILVPLFFGVLGLILWIWRRN